MHLLDCIIGEAATEVSKGGVHVAESSEVTKEFFEVLCAWENEFSSELLEVGSHAQRLDSVVQPSRSGCVL